MFPHSRSAARIVLALIAIVAARVAQAQTPTTAAGSSDFYSQYYQNGVPGTRAAVSSARVSSAPVSAAPVSSAPVLPSIAIPSLGATSSTPSRSATTRPPMIVAPSPTANMTPMYSGGHIGGIGGIGSIGNPGDRHVTPAVPSMNVPTNPNLNEPNTSPTAYNNVYSQYYQNGVPRTPITTAAPVYGYSGKAYRTGAYSPGHSTQAIPSGGGIGGIGQIGGIGGYAQSGVRMAGPSTAGRAMGSVSAPQPQPSGTGVGAPGGPGLANPNGNLFGRGIGVPSLTPAPFGSVGTRTQYRSR